MSSFNSEYIELQSISSEVFDATVDNICRCKSKENQPTKSRIQYIFHYVIFLVKRLLLFVLYSLAIFIIFYSLNLFRSEGLRPVHYLADCRQCQGFIYSLYHVVGLEPGIYSVPLNIDQENIDIYDAVNTACKRAGTPFIACHLFRLFFYFDGNIRSLLLLGTKPEIICISMWFCTDSCCISDSLPEQIHLALTRHNHEMNIMSTFS